MHITLTGNLGSGKSTICKILEETYGYEIYSTGKIQRSLAAELGISVLEMNQLMCTDHKYDKMIDDTTAKISRENQDKNIVFDSRLAWNFVERAFKVFLSVSLEEAAKRVYFDNRGAVETYTSVEEAKEQLKLRAKTEDIRYRDIYGIHYFDFNNYNLVLDSTYCSPELLAEVLMSEGKNEGAITGTKILISPKRLGIETTSYISKTTAYYPKEIVKIKKTDTDYSIVEGIEIAKQAAEEGFLFVQGTIL